MFLKSFSLILLLLKHLLCYQSSSPDQASCFMKLSNVEIWETWNLFKLTNIACLGRWGCETRKLNGREKQIQEYAWRKQWRISTWVGRIEVSRADNRWSKEPRMLIMESVMLWLFPMLSRINCALAANASTSLDIPISKHPSRLPLSHPFCSSVAQCHQYNHPLCLSLL